ncbi:malate dehydrogenase (oxaloacetate-decarboxylating) [Alkalibacterium olivapovliticus]|uniref:Malate dehydrogenase (Oxaloacetate-decarboxylating) n=1 Tax=Alkalibacterium olivapovliticus TaxID=99907 RepID=A0A2T0W6P4_9LACT|nr:malate dehydrogenase (oxaloacetate-decarboxylating) [Alkalibacterium olivapovliticus]
MGREKYGMNGLLPSRVETIDEQADRVLAQVDELADAYNQHRFLMSIYSTNRTLFFNAISRDVKKLLPVIYTPTIAEAVKKFSQHYFNPKDAVYLSVNEPDQIEQVLKNGAADLSEVKLMVITDGEGVLGIGDWGINGAAISIGKLAVYTVAAGLDPSEVLPIVIDAGTNNQALLDAPSYLGLKEQRVHGEEYLHYIDQFVQTAARLFPNVLFHWEDFGREHADVILNTYRQTLCTFNDDIQGTGIMMVAALNSVVKVTEAPLSEHTVLIFGAGTAGIGIADTIYSELVNKGLEAEEAKKRIVLYDRYGLIHSEQKELTSGQKRYAVDKDSLASIPGNLLETIHLIKPTVLIGCSGQTDAFSEEVVKAMQTHTNRPAIFPISNPSELAEAKAEDIIKWTDGNGLVVTGSPTEPIVYKGVTYQIGQANNALLYPGLGQGLIITRAHHVTDGILLAAAHSVNEMLDLSKPGEALLPDVSKLREVSKLVATAVITKAVEDKVSRVPIKEPAEAVEESIWEPVYKSV